MVTNDCKQAAKNAGIQIQPNWYTHKDEIKSQYVNSRTLLDLANRQPDSPVGDIACFIVPTRMGRKSSDRPVATFPAKQFLLTTFFTLPTKCYRNSQPISPSGCRPLALAPNSPVWHNVTTTSFLLHLTCRPSQHYDWDIPYGNKFLPNGQGYITEVSHFIVSLPSHNPAPSISP